MPAAGLVDARLNFHSGCSTLSNAWRSSGYARRRDLDHALVVRELDQVVPPAGRRIASSASGVGDEQAHGDLLNSC
jgi:hypothetical protein